MLEVFLFMLATTVQSSGGFDLAEASAPGAAVSEETSITHPAPEALLAEETETVPPVFESEGEKTGQAITGEAETSQAAPAEPAETIPPVVESEGEEIAQADAGEAETPEVSQTEETRPPGIAEGHAEPVEPPSDSHSMDMQLSVELPQFNAPDAADSQGSDDADGQSPEAAEPPSSDAAEPQIPAFGDPQAPEAPAAAAEPESAAQPAVPDGAATAAEPDAPAPAEDPAAAETPEVAAAPAEPPAPSAPDRPASAAPAFLAPPGAAKPEPAQPRDDLVAEPQRATGRFLTALEVRPILNATKFNWINVREYGGKDLLYVTHLWSWRCGLLELRVGINGATPEVWPLPECHTDRPQAAAILEGDGVPYRQFPLRSVQLIEIQLVYDDLTTDRVRFNRAGVIIP